eukprot:2472539-Alexandrium_andersonii.AAC.1
MRGVAATRRLFLALPLEAERALARSQGASGRATAAKRKAKAQTMKYWRTGAPLAFRMVRGLAMPPVQQSRGRRGNLKAAL